MCNTVVKPGPYILLFIKAQTKYSIVPQTGIRIQIIPLTTPVVVDKDAVSDCSESNILPVSGGRIDFVVPKFGRKGILFLYQLTAIKNKNTVKPRHETKIVANFHNRAHPLLSQRLRSSDGFKPS